MSQGRTLCMQISNPSWSQVQTALSSGLRRVNPQELLLTIAPSVLDGKKPYSLDQIKAELNNFKGTVRFFEGTDTREEVAVSRLFSYDKATSDWIVNLDDDDIVLQNVPLQSIGPRTGMFHTDIVGVYVENYTCHKAGEIILRKSQEILFPENSNKFWGSFWGIRRAAWDEVKSRVDRNRVGYNDWRLAWHVINAGWKDHHQSAFCQLQRIRDYKKVKAYQKAKAAGGWLAVCEDLKERWG